jgi:hypothetical protein
VYRRVDQRWFHSFCLPPSFQLSQARLPEGTVALEPTGHASQWQRIGGVDALSPGTDIDHQPNIAQYAQMLRYCWPTKWKICSHRTRVGWSASQKIQDRTSGWIGDGVKYVISIRSLHRGKPMSSQVGRLIGLTVVVPRPLFLLVVLRLCWSPHIGAGDTSYFGYRVIRQIDRLMRLADGFFIWPRHETERLSFLQIDVRGMTEDTKVFGGLFKRGKLPEELLFGQFLLGKAAFAFVVGVHEIFHLMLLLV